MRVDIITSTSLDQLQQIQYQFQHLIESQAPDTSYLKKLESENVNSIIKLIQSKQNQLSRVNFKFIGEPQPPTHINKSKQDKEVLSDFHSNSITVLDQYYELNSDHIYVSRFSNSILSVESQSINLQNGEGSICYLRSTGPVFVQNATNCIFIISCHQVRLHEITDSIVIAENRHKGNPIIIENCSRLLINDVDVDDFNHPSKSTKSPNYDTLLSEEMVRIRGELRETNLSNLTTSVSSFLQLRST